MKLFKKVLATVVAAITALTLAVPAMAAEEGTIKITNAMPGQEYSVYKIFDLDSYNKEAGAYVYTVNDAWEDFIIQEAISGQGGYVSVDASNGSVSWKKKDVNGANAGMADFAKLALAYAKANSIPATKTETAGTASGSTTVELTFSNLGLGYYLLDSNVGTLCSLNTTDPNVTVMDKNGTPTVEKKVKEGDSWADENGAQIGDKVEFQVTITAQSGAQNYILHEMMGDGLTFTTNSVAVTKGGQPVSDDNYTVNASPKDGHTFDVVFADAFCDSLAAGDEIVVTYNAILNENADVHDGENNDVYVTYGEDNDLETTHDDTDTYTYQVQVIKTNDQAEAGKFELLDGAIFKLYTQEIGGEAIKFVKDAEGNYRVATANDAITTDEIEAGHPIISGLDNSVKYYLEETKAPAGYNPVEGRQEITLAQGNNVANSGAIDTTANTYAQNGGGIQVQNSKGNKLPSTGGMGTTAIYAVGAVLVIGAGAALVITRRNAKDRG